MDDGPMAKKPEPPVERASGNSTGIRVVLVEDHSRLRQQLSGLLKDAGMRVLAEVGTVREGREAVARHQPDVVVIDSRLPDGGGLALCRLLLLDVPRVALLLHAATPTMAEEHEALHCGVAAVVAKSIRGHALLEAIRRHAPNVR
jgi:two-component system response regulator DevR